MDGKGSYERKEIRVQYRRRGRGGEREGKGLKN